MKSVYFAVAFVSVLVVGSKAPCRDNEDFCTGVLSLGGDLCSKLMGKRLCPVRCGVCGEGEATDQATFDAQQLAFHAAVQPVLGRIDSNTSACDDFYTHMCGGTRRWDETNSALAWHWLMEASLEGFYGNLNGTQDDSLGARYARRLLEQLRAMLAGGEAAEAEVLKGAERSLRSRWNRRPKDPPREDVWRLVFEAMASFQGYEDFVQLREPFNGASRDSVLFDKDIDLRELKKCGRTGYRPCVYQTVLVLDFAALPVLSDAERDQLGIHQHGKINKVLSLTELDASLPNLSVGLREGLAWWLANVRDAGLREQFLVGLRGFPEEEAVSGVRKLEDLIVGDEFDLPKKLRAVLLADYRETLAESPSLAVAKRFHEGILTGKAQGDQFWDGFVLPIRFLFDPARAHKGRSVLHYAWLEIIRKSVIMQDFLGDANSGEMYDAYTQVVENVRATLINTFASSPGGSTQQKLDALASVRTVTAFLGQPASLETPSGRARAYSAFRLRQWEFLDERNLFMGLSAARLFEARWRLAQYMNPEVLMSSYAEHRLPTSPNQRESVLSDAAFKWGAGIQVDALNFAPPSIVKGYPPALMYGLNAFFVAHEFGHAYNSREDPPFRACVNATYATECALGHPSVCMNAEANGQMTECAADVVGVRAAYEAYKLHAFHSLPEERGMVHQSIGGMSGDALFFAGIGMGWCRAERRFESESDARKFIASGRHPHKRNRVNGMLKQMPEFGAAFNCPSGSKMTEPVEQCRFWTT